MDDLQRTQQEIMENLRDTSASNSGITVDDITSAVDAALKENKSDLSKLDDLGESLTSIEKKLDSISASQSRNLSKSVDVYTVRLDSGQTDTAKLGSRIVCTEGLLIVILLALLSGLQVFRILSERWH